MTGIFDPRWHYAILVREDQLRPPRPREIRQPRRRWQELAWWPRGHSRATAAGGQS